MTTNRTNARGNFATGFLYLWEMSMKKLYLYVKQYWKGYVMAVSFMVVAIILDMIYPLLTKSLVDDVIIEGKMELLTGLLIGIAAVGVGRAFLSYHKEFTFDRLASTVGSDLRKELFHHIQSLSMRYFSNTNTGELMARVKDDVDRIWDIFGYVGMLSLEVVIHVSIVLYCMCTISPKLTILPLITMIFCGYLAIMMEKKLDKIYDGISEENAVLTTVAQENIAGVRTVKAFAREKHEIQKFLSHNNRYYELNITQSRILATYHPFFQLIGKLLPIASTILGGFLVMNGEITLGGLVAFVEYSRNCTWPMEMMGWLTNAISAAFASHKKLKAIYEEKPEIVTKEDALILEEVKGEIGFEHVGFTIENKEILKDISFNIKPGNTLGIMGATGSGKSSIINLLQRFYEVSEGRITLEGRDIRDLTLRQLRSNIAVVSQDIFLFSDSVEENIKLGQRNRMTAEEIRQAAESAKAGEFIEKLEEQYETVIGERGVGLSGGQKQRISIARAFSKKSPILILDDSTSALDMETEREIQETLKEIQNTTKIIIAHRISAVRYADEIIYLKDGRIAERGTHKELLEKKGLYYDTYQAQYGNVIQKGEEKWQ